MKVEKTAYLKIRFDWLFSIYVVFAVAVIVRYVWILSRLLRGKEPAAPDPTKVELRPVNLASPFSARRRWRSSASACSGCRSATR